jgi:voltage-gated potassium channel
MAETVSRADQKGTTYELFILAVSTLSILNYALFAAFTFKSQYWWVVADIEIMLTLVFVLDFSYRLWTAPSRRGYLRHGGVFDLLSCIPLLRIFRLMRIFLITRTLRKMGGRTVLHDMRRQFASGTLYFVVFLLILTLEVVGLLMLYFEMDAPGSNITTGGDALWWGYVTATTVGYGDKYPVTLGGRLVGTIMLTVGVALFATFSGFLANAFLSNRHAKPAAPPDGSPEAALQEIERLLAEQQRATEALRARLLEI